MKNMFHGAGVDKRDITNHSLRATCATRLYQSNIDEQIIMERTGHRSVSGVRAYKRTSEVQMENCSAIIDGESIRKELTKKVCDAEHSARLHQPVITFNMNNCVVTVNSLYNQNNV